MKIFVYEKEKLMKNKTIYYTCPTLKDLKDKLIQLEKEGINLEKITWNGFDDESISTRYIDDKTISTGFGFEPKED